MLDERQSPVLIQLQTELEHMPGPPNGLMAQINDLQTAITLVAMGTSLSKTRRAGQMRQIAPHRLVLAFCFCLYISQHVVLEARHLRIQNGSPTGHGNPQIASDTVACRTSRLPFAALHRAMQKCESPREMPE